MHFFNKESRIDKTTDNGHSLDEHYKLCELKSPVVLCRYHLEVGNHDTVSNAIAYAQHQHAEVPLEFIIRIVGELPIWVNKGLNLQVIRSPFKFKY